MKTSSTTTATRSTVIATAAPEQHEPKQYHTFSYHDGYIFNPKSDKLEQVISKSIVYDLANETETAQVKLAGGDVVEVTEDTELYTSEAEYRNGAHTVQIFQERTVTAEYLLAELPQFSLQRLCIIVQQDGKPVVWNAREQVRMLCFSVDEKGHHKHEALGCTIPTEYYNDLEEYYHWNELVTLNADGTETRTGGDYAVLMPTAEQRTVIDEVFAALERAKELGVRFYYDNDYDKFFAANFADRHLDTRWDGDYREEDVERNFSLQKVMRQGRLPQNNLVWQCGECLDVIVSKEEIK